MSSHSETKEVHLGSINDNRNYISTLTLFPPVVNGNIDVEQFLKASTDIVGAIDKIGKVFAPVKYDMLGNIEKIKNCYNSKQQPQIHLFDLVESEIKTQGNQATEGLLWLNRALLFLELIFEQVIDAVRTNTHQTASMKKIFTAAYEKSVKKYHNWVVQQLFALICKTSPSLPQILKAFDVEDLKSFENDLHTLNVTLNIVRREIEDFYKVNNICQV